MIRENYITSKGLTKLKEELEYLKTIKRQEIASRIEKAKDLGDLSENAEYAEAKDEQAFLEGRIAELETIIHNAILINNNKQEDRVTIGSTIKVKIDDSEKEYTIVGSQETDPLRGMISNESPLARACLGKRVGETVEVVTQKGIVKYTIVEIK